MDGSPDTDHTHEEWEDVEEELSSTLREACSFSFDPAADPPADRPPAPPAAFEALRERRPLLTSRRPPTA